MLVLVAIGLACEAWAPAQAWAQTPPSYSELFQDPPQYNQLTQDDLPNLGRLVALEATSMFVHVRSDLGTTAESYALLNEITTVWHAADAFVAATSYFPTEVQRIQAGRLVFPTLQAAFFQLRDSLGRFPGSSMQATLNLMYMSRSMAVIGPLLGENPPGTVATVSAVPARPTLSTVRELARELLPLVQSLRGEVASRAPASASELDRDLDVLKDLVVGLDWIAYGGATEPEVVASIRPLGTLAQRIDPRMQRPGLIQPMYSQWSAIKQRIAGLTAQFQLPREIVPLAAQVVRAVDPARVTPINEAVNEIIALLERPSQTATAGGDRVVADLHRLRTRLFLLRQFVLGQSPELRVSRAIQDVESAARQLEADAYARHFEPRDKVDGLVRKVQEVVAKVREGTSSAR
jgi:hypothetical protein